VWYVKACCGTKLDHGVDVTDTLTDGRKDVTSSSRVFRIPIEADFLYMYSSAPGESAQSTQLFIVVHR